MTAKYLNELRHQGAVAEIANLKFPFPGPGGMDFDTIVNVPTHRMAVGEDGGKDIFPDIVVVRRPGQWLMMMAQVETPDTVSEYTAEHEWLPLSKVGDLYLYVPAGMVPETKKLIKKHKVSVKGIRTWRFRPVWGLDVTEA